MSAAMRQLGVDVRSREALEAAGIAPERGAGVALLGPGRTLSVVGVKDASALEPPSRTLARNRLGAGERAEVKVDGRTLVTFRRRGAALPVLGLLVVDDYALIGAGGVVGELARFAALPPAQSLAEEPVLTASLARLPKELDLYAFLPGGGGLLPQGSVQGLTLTGASSRRPSPCARTRPGRTGRLRSRCWTGSRGPSCWATCRRTASSWHAFAATPPGWTACGPTCWGPTPPARCSRAASTSRARCWTT